MHRRQIGYLICVVMLLAWAPVTLADTVPEEAHRYMARGSAAVEMAKTPKDYERAVREFEQAAKLAPDWPDVYSNLGSAQAKAGNYGEAMRHYKHYLELAPKAPDAAKVREEIYKLEYRAEQEKLKKDLRKERGRFSLEDGVIYDSQLGLEWAPSNGQVLNHYQAEGYARDLSLAGGGWRLPTREELKSLYDKTKPGNVDPVFGVGNMGVWTSELYNEVPSNPCAVFNNFSKGGEFAHSNTFTHNVLAVRSGQSIVIEPNPKDADAYYSRGAAYRKKGMFDQAIEEFNKAVELNPKYVDAYVVRGSTYYLKRGHDQAISDYSKAIELNPKLAGAYNGRGAAYRMKGDLDQAISDYTKAIELNPEYTDAYNDRGAAYFGKKEYDKAWQDVHMAESLGAKEPPGFLDALKKASGREK